ncbi:DUF5000 domain-containing lipoprotein [Flavitalea sp. BT771]|uniref:DUF5000 domain-containing lipoprotein n=1 Tax=Flavitalea sp. BT771 TaxID=3063329 RepID=UPI0026E33535|nr:DUF5000 domain-containing lipoprotein [Flavitalea sp. BT771]MDO6435684.1 DUF5000 domain-containing lipoprotein [Flavitalea sp. BT771]MDV6224585.1 DUF5000 domain-containing lipoprotein [Flavitalea sp. BT771]
MRSKYTQGIFTGGLLWLLILCACKKETHDPTVPGGPKPAPVANVQVKNLPGGAELTYSLPNSDGLLYVLATFDRSPGDVQQVKASYYNNSLQVLGFPDTLPHQVSLYAVTRGEVKSDPVVVTVNPTLPPVMRVFRSLTVKADFGGINILFTNPDTAHIVIVTCSNDSTGKYTAVNNHYTNAWTDSFAVHGFDTARRKFGVFIKDQYGNHSDTLTVFLSPYYEKFVDKGTFSELDLPGDIQYDWGLPMPNLWDNSIGDWSIWHSQPVPSGGWPVWITFDMGKTVKLSRCALWQRQSTDWIYAQNNLRVFEIWGSTHPNPDGSWDNSWFKVLSHQIIKPSGLPETQDSQADIDAAVAGEQMNVSLDVPPARYIRIKIFSTWSMNAANIAEISFWGTY